jgi:hypothetical protein
MYCPFNMCGLYTITQAGGVGWVVVGAAMFFFNPMPPHVRHGLCGLPPGCGRSVTDFWGWAAHEARLRCPDEVDGDIWIWSTRGALNLNSTNYPDHGLHGDPPLSGKNPHGRAGNRTRDLMISSQKRWQLDREAGRGQ